MSSVYLGELTVMYADLNAALSFQPASNRKDDHGHLCLDGHFLDWNARLAIADSPVRSVLG